MACGTTYDIGCNCDDRAASASNSNTYIDFNRAAASGGTVDYIYIYCCSTGSGIEYGAFENISGNSFTCRGNCNGANLGATADQCVTHEAGVDFTAFDFDAGEYIGLYFSGG